MREPALRQDADHPLGTAARGGRLRGCLKPAMSLRELYLELKSLHRKLDVEGAARKMIKGMSDKVSVTSERVGNEGEGKVIEGMSDKVGVVTGRNEKGMRKP